MTRSTQAQLDPFASTPRRFRAHPTDWAAPAVLAATVAVGSWAGVALAIGGLQRSLAVALGAGAVVGASLWAALAGRVRPGFLAVEAPVALLLASTLVLRIRDTEALAANPVDLAGSYRLACLMAALALSFLSLVGHQGSVGGLGGRITTRPFRLYVAYVFVVFLGALPSVDPFLTAFRGVELGAGVLVLIAAYRTVGPEALIRIQSVLYWWIAALVGSVWLGMVAFPGQTIAPSNSPIPVQIRGVLPVISSNGLGTLGVILCLWSLGLVLSRSEDLRSGRATKLLCVLGFATLLLAQYRTGYAMFAVGVVVLLAMRSPGLLAFGVVFGVAIASIWGSVVLERAEPLALRGQSLGVATELSGRVRFWTLALQLWQESPWIGKGLLTGTRFEVLAQIGRETTSTIHGTWVEALVGTGIIGAVFLLAAVGLAIVRAFVEGIGRGGHIVPAVLLSMVLIRSLTGTTFESFGTFALLTLTLALTLRDPPVRWPGRSVLQPDADFRPAPPG